MSSYKVLIAEDEGLIARDIADRLEALGHSVVAMAGTAEEALDNAAAADVVLMDIRLDGPRDGIEAAKEIRSRFHLPIIFLTAHADRNTLERAKLAQPFGYIVKPMAHAALQTTLEIAMYRHRMERELELRESWLRTTLSSVSDAVIATDTKGAVLLCNEAAQTLLGSEPDKIVDVPSVNSTGLAAAASSIDLAKYFPDDPIALAILRDAPVAIDTSIREQAVEGSAAPVKASGTTVGAVLILRNVTLKRWQEQQARQAQKFDAAARLAAGVSADYAAHLAIVSKETHRLLARFPGQTNVRQSLEEIQHAAASAEEITRRLAGLGLRQAGKPEVLSLNRVLRLMQRTIESVLERDPGEANTGAADFRVVIRQDASVGKIRADAGQLQQMILNLVTLSTNAAKPGPGATVYLETANAGAYASLTVTSTGSGEIAYDPSTELELSLAHAIAGDYSGLLMPVEERERTGFRVLLPVWQPADQVTETDEKTHTLLLIEPRESVRRQLHNFFEAAGYNLLEAENREEAVTLLEIHGSPDQSCESTGGGPDYRRLAIDLVIGDAAATRGISQVPVVLTDAEAAQAMSQNALLEKVRARLSQELTFSVSV